MAARFTLELGRTEQRLAWAEVAAWKQLAHRRASFLQEHDLAHMKFKMLAITKKIVLDKLM